MRKLRSQIFKELDVTPRNSRWAWCAKNDRLKIAVFTIWEDEEQENNSWLLHDPNETYKRNGFFDQKKVLELCRYKHYKAFGLVAKAEDPSKSPRSIESIDESHLIELRLIEYDSKIYGYKKKEVSFLDFISKNKKQLSKDGLSDLASPPIGKEIPDRAITKGITFKRNTKVRSFVINRAKGVCEYCGRSSFKLNGGEYYLESHHIISLASDGKDTVENVIALCPNHHREAHYGKNAEQLEREFVEIVKNKVSIIE